MKYTISRADTALAKNRDGTWRRVAANDWQTTYLDDLRKKIAWISKPLTNEFRNSEPATDPGQGTRTALTFGASTLGLGFSTALDGMVTLSGGSTSRVYHNVASAPANNSQGTVAFICQKIAGGEPTVNSGTVANDDIQAIWGGGSVTSVTEVSITSLGSDLYFVRVKLTAAGTATDATGVQQSNTYAGTGVRVSAIMAVAGHIGLNIFDYIRTTGSSAARAVTDIRNTSFPLLSNLQGFIDVELDQSLASKFIMRIGANSSNYVAININSNNTIDLEYTVGGVVQWFIRSAAQATEIDRKRFGYYLSNGLNIFYIDGTEIGRNTSAYVPQGTIKVLGGQFSGTSLKMVNSGFFGEYITSGKTEAELLAVSSFTSLTQFMEFKRATFEDQALTMSLIALLQNTQL